jgi:hypothetical protein
MWGQDGVIGAAVFLHTASTLVLCAFHFNTTKYAAALPAESSMPGYAEVMW